MTNYINYCIITYFTIIRILPLRIHGAGIFTYTGIILNYIQGVNVGKKNPAPWISTNTTPFMECIIPLIITILIIYHYIYMDPLGTITIELMTFYIPWILYTTVIIELTHILHPIFPARTVKTRPIASTTAAPVGQMPCGCCGTASGAVEGASNV